MEFRKELHLATGKSSLTTNYYVCNPMNGRIIEKFDDKAMLPLVEFKLDLYPLTVFFRCVR